MPDGERKLRDKQQRILEFIREYIQEHPYPPSVRDIQQGCNISSTSVVDYNLRLLQRHGYVNRSPEISRGIELVGAAAPPSAPMASVPVLGYIAAGEPLPLFADSFEAEPMDTVELPVSMLPRNGKLFALRAKGLSMIDALIDDGDTVLFEPTRQAENGQMVAAWLKEEGEATLKRFYREGDRVRLQPANAAMEPIYAAADNVEVHGRVVGVLRLLR